MSDIQQGPEWWLGADGKWYPPAAAAPPPPKTGSIGVEPNDPAEPEPSSKRPGWVVPVMVAAVVVVALVGLATFLAIRRSSSEKHPLSGQLTLSTASLIKGKDGSCTGKDGYDDIDPQAQVTVTDGSGKLLATGSLGPGTLATGTTTRCVFPLVMSQDLPKTDFYKVEVSHRGALTYSYDDMKSQNWTVGLKLG